MSTKLQRRKTFSQPWRILNVVCVLFVFAYITFDVLDLDLSEFPVKPTHERAAAVAEVPQVEFADAFAFGANQTFFPTIQNGSLEQLARSLQITTMRVFPHRDPWIVFHRVIFSPQS